MPRKHFKSGDKVVLGKRKPLVGVFQCMHSKAKAVVWVDPTAMDDDGMRLVDIKSLAPYYNDPTDQQRRARHAMRMFKQGIRWFRLGDPHNGATFQVMQIDIVNGTAFGCKKKRKTIQVVPLYDLWPETFK